MEHDAAAKSRIRHKLKQELRQQREVVAWNKTLPCPAPPHPTPRIVIAPPIQGGQGLKSLVGAHVPDELRRDTNCRRAASTVGPATGYKGVQPGAAVGVDQR